MEVGVGDKDWMMADLLAAAPSEPEDLDKKRERWATAAKTGEQWRRGLFATKIYQGWKNYECRMPDGTKCICGRNHKKDVVQVPCGHLFSYTCINKAIKSNGRKCPMCFYTI